MAETTIIIIVMTNRKNSLVVEGRHSEYHFIEHTSETPPVDSIRVGLLQKHLGSQVLGGATEGLRHPTWQLVHPVLRQSEVSNDHVTHSIQQQVLGFHVSKKILIFTTKITIQNNFNKTALKIKAMLAI